MTAIRLGDMTRDGESTQSFHVSVCWPTLLQSIKSTTLNQSQDVGVNLNHKCFKELISLIVKAIRLGDMTRD